MNWAKLARDFRFYFSRKLDFPFIAPVNLTLNLTYRCNQKCIMCSIRKDNYDPGVELSLPEIKDIIDQAAALKIPEIVFTGGEPLIVKEIFSIIEYAAGKNIRPVLITNCFCSKEIVEKLKYLPLSHMQVSIDGLDADTHDLVRQSKGSFSVTLNNIQQLLAFSQRKYSLAATTTILNQNVGQLVDIAKLMKSVGVEKLSIRPAHANNADPASVGKNNSYWVTPDRLKILDAQIDELERYHQETGFIDCRPGFKYIKEYFRDGYIRPTNSCYNGYNRLVIAYNERDSYEIWMCAGMIGDVRKKRLHEIWLSKEAWQARKKMKKCFKSCAFPCCYESGLENLFSIIRKNMS